MNFARRARGYLVRSRRRIGAAAAAGATTILLVNSVSTYATTPPSDPPTTETTAPPTTTESPTTTTESPTTTTGPTTTIEPPATTQPADTEPADTTEPTETSESTDSSEPLESSVPPESSEPGIVAVAATIRLFPDTNGNFLDDEGDEARIGEETVTVAAVVDVTNSSPDAADIAVTVPGTGSSAFAGVDLARLRVAGAPSATVRVAYSDSTSREYPVGGSPTDVTRPELRVESLVVTFTAVAAGSAVRVDVQGTLNESAAAPTIELCADVTGANAGGQATVNDCDGMAVNQPEEEIEEDPGIGVLAVVAQPTWTLDDPPASGTMTIPANGFPAATFTTDSETTELGDGADIFLAADTPFGAAFESTEGQEFLSTTTAVGGPTAPSTTTFQFATPTPPGWGFALGDIDLDEVTITAIGPDGQPLTAAQLGFQGTFNYCTGATGPPACGGAVGTDVPTWDPATSTLTGNGPGSDGASGWFRPTVPITSLTITQVTDEGAVPVMQLWFAARTSDISGTVTAQTSDGSPLSGPPAGTVLQLLNPDGSPALDSAGNAITTTVNPDGTYLFEEVPAAEYVVAIVAPAGFTVVGPAQLPANASSGDVTGVDFLLQQVPPTTTTSTVDISGTVTAQNSEGAPIEVPFNTILVLFDADGNFVDNFFPGPDGAYLFDDVPAGVYSVLVLPGEGFEVVGPDTLPADATSGDVTGVDFLIREPPPTTEPPTTEPETTEPPPPTTIDPRRPRICPPPPPEVEPPPNPEDAPLPPPPTPPPGCVNVLAVAPPAPNPPLQAACGITVALVVDESYSIHTAGATQAVKTALRAFIDTLNNTGSSVAVVEFSEQASVPIQFTPLNDATRGQFDTYISSFNPNGANTKGTNWDDALYQANGIGADADLTLFLTDGQPNRSGVHGGHANSSSRVLEYAVVHANEIKNSGTRMFVVGVGDVAGHTSELAAVSGSSRGTNIATNDYSTVTNFDDLAASLEDLVYGLCASSMTVSKYVDGVLAPGWDVSATITTVTGAPGFDWRNPNLPATPGTPAATRTVKTGTSGTSTFEWVIGSEASPQPGSVTMTLNEVVKPGYRFVSGSCTIDRATAALQAVNFTTLPAPLGTIPFDAIVKCSLNNQTIPVVPPVAPTVAQAQCVNGVLRPPTLTLPPAATGITYTANPASPYASGQTVVVTATLAAGYRWPAEMPPGWTRTSDTKATYTVTFANVSCAPATPLNPGVVQATCTNGTVTAPTITPQTTPGVTYTLSPPGPYVGTQSYTVTVTATLANGYAWVDPLPTGWTKASATTATRTVTLAAASCTEALPVAPTINQAQCVGGQVTNPTLTLPKTDGIIYTTNSAPPYDPGETVIVTATLIGTGFAWPDTLPPGWTETSPTTATYRVTFANATCTPATPLAPVVVQASCANGVVTAPTITPTPTAGITYTATPGGPYNGTQNYTVLVTATLANGFAWVDPLPDGWTKVNAATATFTVTLTAATCRMVAPAAPSVAQAECVGGVVTEPTLLLFPTPGITYSTSKPPPYAPGDTVVLTAKLSPTGVSWPATMPAGWTYVDPVTATYTVTFANVSCTPATPLNPGVVQATCVNGVVTPPTITPKPTDGVTYVLSPTGPYVGTENTTVRVTATLADGYAWVDPLPAGWTRTSATTAEFTVELVAATCTPTAPAAPTVDQAVCVDGGVTEPTLTLPTTDGISYAADPPSPPPYVPGDEVVVTATITAAGIAWPPQASMPPGWTIVTPTTATFEVVFDEVSCLPATPLEPDVVQARCANGVVTVPSVTPTPVAGITYEVAPEGPYDGLVDTTVLVTATLVDGYAWPDPLPEDGWEYVDATTATLTVELVAATCTETPPVAPTVDQAECVDGGVTEPTLTLPETAGISYVAAPEGPYVPGDVVVVTATLDATGVGWPDPLPDDDWDYVDATTATYSVTFDDVSCLPATPLEPVVVQATCANGVLTEPTVTAEDTDGVSYAFVPEGPYDGSVDTTVTVTATLADGYAWPDPSPEDEWDYVDATTATLTLELIGASCTVVPPAAPTVDQAECVDGGVTEPTLTLPETDGISYEAAPAGPYVPGDEVVVTATITAAGIAWPPQASMPPGWTIVTPTTATFEVVFDEVSCLPATPLAPVVAQATCANGVVTEPTIDVPPVEGLSYTVDPAGPYDGTVDTTITVTAMLADGYAWPDPLPDDEWDYVDATTATYTVELAATACGEVVPVLPENHPAECVDGVLVPPTLTLPETAGLTYSVNADPPYAAGQTVIVTATLDNEGVSWPAELPEEWVQTSASTASYTHTFADVSCTTALPVAPEVVMASCAVDGAVVPASVTPASTPGIVYTVAPAEPYDPAVDTEVVVTATLEQGYAWGAVGTAAPVGFARSSSGLSRSLPGAGFVMALPTGWVQTGPTTATFTVVLPALPECPPPTTATVPADAGATTGATTTTTPSTGPLPGTE